MKNKKIVTYFIQSNLYGSFDIVESTMQNRITGNAENEEAAKEIVKYLNHNRNELQT